MLIEKDCSSLKFSSRTQYSLVILFCCALSLTLIPLMIVQESFMSWIFSAFFLIAIILVVSRSTNSYSALVLTNGGFTIEQYGHKTSLCWKDIDFFTLEKHNDDHCVSFGLTDTAKARGAMQKISLPRINPEKVHSRYRFPDNYNLGAFELQKILKEWKRK